MGMINLTNGETKKFCTCMYKLMVKLRTHIKNKNLEDVSLTANQLKSTSGLTGHSKIENYAYLIELFSEKKDFAGIDFFYDKLKDFLEDLS